MKLIINTSNLNGGGGVQVALSFIYECLKFSENKYHIFLCPKIQKELNINSFPDNFHFYIFPYPPAPTFKGWHIIKRLNILENEINPDIVFSIFGPSYWTPKAIHLMGFAIPHFLYPKSSFFSNISMKEKMKWKILFYVKQFFFKRNADYYHVETNEVRQKLLKFLSCSEDRVITVPNTYNSLYNTFILKSSKLLPEKIDFEFRFICISAYYSHKNFEIINKIVPLLSHKGYTNIKFVLTISNDILDKIFTKQAQEYVINIGQINVVDCPQLYSECDALFLPTLLECFSASYPEAMKMNIPILTSDLPFAHDICGDAALYFDPLDEKDISNKIISIIENNELKDSLVKKGNIQVNKFISAEQRASNYLKICEDIRILKK